MKKATTLALCLFAIALSANAQDALSKKQLAEKGITLKMSYDDYKTMYNPRITFVRNSTRILPSEPA